MAKKKLFEIDKDSIVKGTKGGYMYCTTTPEHPYGEKRKDRKKKYIYLHRALLEQKLNRYLKPEEQSDHKDGDKTHNYVSNLVLRERGPHQKSHADRGNHFWKKSPRNKPGRKASALRVASRFAGALYKEKYVPVKKLTEPKKEEAERVAKITQNEKARALYKGFLSDPAYIKMPQLFPKYNGEQAQEATDYLMKAFEKKNHVQKFLLDKVRDKILAGIT